MIAGVEGQDEPSGGPGGNLRLKGHPSIVALGAASVTPKLGRVLLAGIELRPINDPDERRPLVEPKGERELMARLAPHPDQDA